MTKKSRNALLVILATIIVILVALIFSINLILGNILSDTINAELESMSKQTDKHFSVDKVKVNIFSRTITLKNIKITPDSILFEKLRQAKLSQVSIMEINITAVKFQGFNIWELGTKRNFILKKIIVKGAEFTLYKNELNIKGVEDAETPPPMSIDSIYIKGLNGINLNKVIIDEYRYTTIDLSSNDTIFSFSGSDFEIKGFSLESSEITKGFFWFNSEKLSLKMRRQRIDLNNENYYVFLKKLDFSFSDSLITINEFMVKPTRDKYKLGASYKYTKEVIDVEVESIKILGNKIGLMLRQGIVEIDSILVDGLKLDLYKDRTRPFDLDKRPLFIQEQLKKLKQPLHISKVKISNSNFIYALRPEGSEKLLYVNISDLEGEISFITSFRDSIQSAKKLRVNISGQLMSTAALELNIIMPYNSAVDTFYFSGKLGAANFAKFNPALYPATGIKFKGGKLKSMKFYANASPKAAKGLMTMLYNDLEAEIPKKDAKETNKFLSFGANAVLRTSNPNKNGKTKVALIKNERVDYKGFGNMLWKSVQAGLVNTILPTGQTHRASGDVAKSQKQNSKKKNWWKKKKK